MEFTDGRTVPFEQAFPLATNSGSELATLEWLNMFLVLERPRPAVGFKKTPGRSLRNDSPQFIFTREFDVWKPGTEGIRLEIAGRQR